MNNLGLEVQQLKTKLIKMERKKHGLLKQMKKEYDDIEIYRKWMVNWKK